MSDDGDPPVTDEAGRPELDDAMDKAHLHVAEALALSTIVVRTNDARPERSARTSAGPGHRMPRGD